MSGCTEGLAHGLPVPDRCAPSIAPARLLLTHGSLLTSACLASLQLTGQHRSHIYSDSRSLSKVVPFDEALERKIVPQGLPLDMLTFKKPAADALFGVHLRSEGSSVGSTKVTSVEAGSIAELSGVRVGDAIHDINGQSVQEAEHAAHLLGAAAPGTVVLLVARVDAIKAPPRL